jgi:hypothetical protein
MGFQTSDAFQSDAFQGGLFSFVSTQAGASPDYAKYIWGRDAVVVVDRVNQPSLLDFSLVPWDGSFVKLVRGAYIALDSDTYPNWFTGYITNDPELTLIGSRAGNPVYGYRYEATDDSYLLSLNPIGVLPPFVNTSCGTILKTLVSILDSNSVFDVSGVQSGNIFARYVIDPTKKFMDIVKELADASAFRFRATNKKIYFEPKDTTPATISIDGTSKHFNAGDLTFRATTDAIVNDAIVVGNVEPENYVNEYMVGDGLTGAFPLLSGIFGVDSSILLDEPFSGSSLNTDTWGIFDTPVNFLQVSQGYLNCLGGSANNSFDVFLQSQKVMPLEGQLRLTHGEYDFVNSASVGVNGVVCGLWTQAPNSAYTGCLFGIRVNKSGVVTSLNPITNGTVDGGQSVTINFAHRYIIRTLCSFKNAFRQQTAYGYLDVNGVTGTFGGVGVADTVDYTTWIVEIDPSNGSVVSTTQWSNLGVSLSNSTVYANYIPLASNDLHCTLSNITLSTPMQASLEVKSKGAGAYTKKLIGPNEVDSLDGLAPVATVVTDGSGTANNNNTSLGVPKYNPGNATLTFFKDTTKQISYLPQVGDLVHLSYRRAALAMGRVQDPVSIATESAAWGDNGLRSLSRLDITPPPRTSAECEAAAAAIVKDQGFQHYEGSYRQYHPYEFTGLPLSGTVLKFLSMPSSFPSYLTGEVITEVKTTMWCASPRELFEHEITFGRKDHLSKVIQKNIGKTYDEILGAVDASVAPTYAQVIAVGNTTVPDVVAPFLVSVDPVNINLNTGQAPPSGGGFEIRYTDDSWGADAAKNLIVRTASQTFAVPRTSRGKVCFIKAYDTRNRVLYSEDLTQASWTKTNATVANSTIADPDGNKSLTSAVTITVAGGSVYHTTATVAASKQAVGSISIKGTPGKQVTVQLADGAGAVLASQTITLTANWKRVSVSGTFSSGATGNIRLYVVSVVGSGTQVFSATRVSIETGRLTETQYFKTVGTEYGAQSRYAAAVRVNFPFIPPAPTASLTLTDPANPVVNVILPGTLQDVWGVEIRASDNFTVVYKADLTDAGFNPSWVHANNTNRSQIFFIYTYNLLGEYSAVCNLNGTIPTPSASGLTVDEGSGKLVWVPSNSSKALVEIATDAGFTAIVLSKTVTDAFLALDDETIIHQRYFRVTPQDSIGSGTAITTSHIHTPAGVIDSSGGGSVNNTDNTYSVPFQPTPTTYPTHPSPFTPWSDQLNEISQRQTLLGRYYQF